MAMRYLSVCSGIEAATVAWRHIGWHPAGFAEIDRFPSAILEYHYPKVTNYGDFTNIRAADVGSIDLLAGGTPCQSFSIAGLRGGLDDDRGNLALEFCRLAQRTRPRWIVWENVPGVLSLDGGRAFAAILGGLAECGYGLAYRVLDAQYVRVDGFARAVPQRRRRVFVVGYLGDWRCAAAVLFEPARMRRDTPPRRKEGQNPAPTLSARPSGGGGLGTDFDCDGGLVSHALRGEGFDASEDGTGRGTPLVSHTLNGKGGAGRMDFESETFAIQERAIAENEKAGPDGIGVRADGCAYTLESRTVSQAIAFSTKDYGNDACAEVAPTLRSMSHSESHANAGGQLGIAFDMRGRDGGAQFEGPHNTANIRASSGGSSRSYISEPLAVRRLTPLECERLQGFPDGYTLIQYRGKSAADGPRYKALGNSMAVNVMRWIGNRIDRCELIRKEDTNI